MQAQRFTLKGPKAHLSKWTLVSSLTVHGMPDRVRVRRFDSQAEAALRRRPSSKRRCSLSKLTHSLGDRREAANYLHPIAGVSCKLRRECGGVQNGWPAACPYPSGRRERRRLPSSARAGAREASCADFGIGVWGFNPKGPGTGWGLRSGIAPSRCLGTPLPSRGVLQRILLGSNGFAANWCGIFLAGPWPS
jgi:hypothetical protein